MFRILKKFIFTITYILISIYLLIFLPVLWGHKPLVILSGSMEPTLKVGGILYYHEIDIEDFKNGDILVYETKDHIISHRIVDRADGDFITKGDANNTYDSSLVNKNQVLGKSQNWCIPYIGYYADYIYHHKYLIFIALSIICIDICIDSYKVYKKKTKESEYVNENNS